MMTIQEVMQELESYGSDVIKKIAIKHGARESIYGVRVQDMKKILKKVKKNHELSLDLYATGNADAMYLAGLMADETKMTKGDLHKWAKEANYHLISEYTVPWVAAESGYGYELGLEWIDSDLETIASSGWTALAYHAALTPDDEMNLEVYAELLDRVQKNIHTAQNRVRYTMNGFVIAIGSYIAPLSGIAIDVATNIGKIPVDMGGTSCKVPLATTYIKKVHDSGNLGKKRKKVRC